MGGVNRETRAVFRWLTRDSAQMLGPSLDHAYAIDETPCFDDALKAIDEAERQVWNGCEPAAEPLE